MDSNCLNVHRIDADGILVEFETLIPKELSDEEKTLKQFYDDYYKTLDEVERLTNNADGLDYALAATSGVIAGLIDIVFVGELGLFKDASEEAKKKFQADKGEVHKKLNQYIEKYARRKGYKGKGLKGAIEFLEKKYPVDQDNTWSGKKISSTNTHHLDDLAHHPTILGLISAIIVQYLRLGIFANKDGEVNILVIEIDKKEFVKNIFPIVLSGVIKWLIYMVERKEIITIDEEIPKPIQFIVEKLYALPAAIPILKTVDNWYGHLVSDMGGSKQTAGGGTGIPGLFLSLLKEISMLPGIKDSELPKLLKNLYIDTNVSQNIDKLNLKGEVTDKAIKKIKDKATKEANDLNLAQLVNDLYQGTKASPLTDKLDLRAELTVFEEQKLPTYINELLVRTTYFVSHLIKELQTNDLESVNWKNIIPFYNRTIVRMMTISIATMEAIDIADAAIRAGIKSGGTLPGFASQFFMRINFVGIGRLVIACSTDAAMGLKKDRLEYALASGDVAITADEMVTMIEKIENIKTGTNHNIKQLTEQTEELSNFKF